MTELQSTRLAARRASEVMDTVNRAFALLIEEMADLENLPDGDKLDKWCHISHWLTDQLENERKNIASALEWKPA